MCNREYGIIEDTGECELLFECKRTDGVKCVECNADYILHFYDFLQGTVLQKCLIWKNENDESNYIEAIGRNHLTPD